MTDLATWAFATVAASAVSGIVGAAGVLGSQLINARHSLKTKRLELLYGRRAIAYHTLLEAAENYAIEPSHAGYLRYLAASQNALILSSEAVARVLNSKALSVSVGRAGPEAARSKAEVARQAEVGVKVRCVNFTFVGVRRSPSPHG